MKSGAIREKERDELMKSGAIREKEREQLQCFGRSVK
jgi:hypothetical protein